RDGDRVPDVRDVVASLLDDRVVLHRPLEEQKLRGHRERLELCLEARQDHPEDREEDNESGDPGDHRDRRGPDGGDSTGHFTYSRFLPMRRTRKIATMLASTTATMPPAEAPPTSYCKSAWA